MPRVQLQFLNVGSYFTIGGRTATLIDLNNSEARVKIVAGEDAGKIIGWSPATEIDKIVPALIVSDVVSHSLTCEICGKVCTSTSGMTLHRKNRH